MNPLLRRLIAGSAGTVIGTLLASELGFFWFLGALLGGVSGYILYDPSDAWACTVRAWKEVAGKWPSKEFWSLYGSGLLFLLLLGSSTVIPVIFVVGCMLIFESLYAFMMILSTLVALGALIAVLMLEVIFSEYDRIKRKPGLLSRKILVRNARAMKRAYAWAPWSVFSAAAVWILRLPTHIFATAKIAGRIGARALRYMHSHQREAVLFDSFIGSSIGWFYGSVLYGLIGGIAFFALSVVVMRLVVGPRAAVR